ncbi:MAG: cytochrome-c peroxidase [Zetaproteobacteria bacterium]|nr:MAG: cytochrome-c peroxidase [Zetaproteobacteria bacterium]
MVITMFWAFCLGQVQALAAEISDAAIVPLERPKELSVEKIRLGRRLFHDTRLSHDNSISCAHCHDLAHGGADHTPHSYGVGGAEGVINAPTVYNAGLNLAQFWDGRAATLEEQIDGPIHNPVEMASNWPEVLAKLRADASYVESFARVFGGKITEARVKEAIAEFERSLVTVDSPFDRYLRGDATAISEVQKRGYRLFISYGCVSCHQGANVGGNLFQVMGVFGDYFRDRGGETKADLGRYNVTGLARDRHKFKVPSLRLVVLTAPYFHDGSAETLDQAIRVMAKYQLGRDIPDEDIADIIAFLHSLVGKMDDADAHE